MERKISRLKSETYRNSLIPYSSGLVSKNEHRVSRRPHMRTASLTFCRNMLRRRTPTVITPSSRRRRLHTHYTRLARSKHASRGKPNATPRVLNPSWLATAEAALKGACSETSQRYAESSSDGDEFAAWYRAIDKIMQEVLAVEQPVPLQASVHQTVWSWLQQTPDPEECLHPNFTQPMTGDNDWNSLDMAVAYVNDCLCRGLLQIPDPVVSRQGKVT